MLLQRHLRLQSPCPGNLTLLVAATAEENLTPDELAAFFILLVGMQPRSIAVAIMTQVWRSGYEG
jgi:hypothetical protein